MDDPWQTRLQALELIHAEFRKNVAAILSGQQDRIGDLESGLGMMLQLVLANPESVTPAMRKIVDAVMADKKDELEALAAATRAHMPSSSTPLS